MDKRSTAISFDELRRVLCVLWLSEIFLMPNAHFSHVNHCPFEYGSIFFLQLYFHIILAAKRSRGVVNYEHWHWSGSVTVQSSPEV